ncbi:KH-likey domain-containing 1 isoform X2 [Sigmodon hispidus]
MEANGVNENAWWTEPKNFDDPLVMFIDEGLEELIFGHGDLYLRRIEVHSNTLIQLERWFTPSGQTRVTVVGPFRVKQWLMDMIQKLGSQETYQQSQGSPSSCSRDQLLVSVSILDLTGAKKTVLRKAPSVGQAKNRLPIAF